MPTTGSHADATRHDDLTHDAVSTRAGGRPPEEASSEDPEHQAQVILEESEDRTTERSEQSTDG